VAAVNLDYLSCWERASGTQISAWPMVPLHQAELGRLSFEPYRILQRDRVSGEALWISCSVHDAFVGLAFGWQAVAPGVLAIGDIPGITTNALLLSENGVLAPSIQTAQCVRLVQSLPWRVEVLRRLEP
jgi:hypothetical protein